MLIRLRAAVPRLPNLHEAPGCQAGVSHRSGCSEAASTYSEDFTCSGFAILSSAALALGNEGLMHLGEHSRKCRLHG